MADLKVGFNVEGVPRSEAIFLRAVNKMVSETKRMRTSFDQLNKSMKSSGRQVEDTAKRIKKSTKELGYMERALGTVRKAWDYSTKSIFNFKNAIIVVIAQMAATKLFNITKDIFNIGAEFEKMMVTVKMVSGATIKEYQAMTNAARALGGSTEYTATQVADAMRFLAMAGLEANEVLKALPSTLNFATAANLTMGESADISTNIMTAMGLKVEDLSMVHDTLTTTIQSSNTTVKEIAESMKYSATTANLMGIDIQFLSAMLGKLGDSGIKGCYDKETEVLTKKGFKFWEDVDANDEFITKNPTTGKLEYQKATKLFKYEVDEDLIQIKTRHIDLKVTENHNMFVKLKGKNNFELIQAEDMYGKTATFTKTGIWEGKEVETYTIPEFIQNRGNHTKVISDISVPIELWLNFLGFWMSDGHASKGNDGNYKIGVSQKKEKQRTQLRQIFNELPFNFNEQKDRFEITNQQLHNELITTIGRLKKDKEIPEWLKNLPPRLLNIFLDAFIQGDGDINDAIYSSYPKLIDGLCEIILKCGYGVSATKVCEKGKVVTIKGRKVISKRDGYKININKTQLTPTCNPSEYKGKHGDRLKNSETYGYSKQHYKGYVYCAEVPNHTLFIRRNGKTVFCGNSMAGTALNNAFIKINKNMPEFANGTEGMIALLVKLKEQSWGLTKALETFGLRGARPMLVLANSSDDAVEKLMKLYKEIQNGTKSTEDFAEAIRETAWGSLRVFQSAVEDIKLEVFSNKSGEMTETLNILTDAIKENKTGIVSFLNSIVQATVDAAPVVISLAESFIPWIERLTVLISLLEKAIKYGNIAEKYINPFEKAEWAIDTGVEFFNKTKIERDISDLVTSIDNFKNKIDQNKIKDLLGEEPVVFKILEDDLKKLLQGASLENISNQINETTEELYKLKVSLSDNPTTKVADAITIKEERIKSLWKVLQEKGTDINKWYDNISGSSLKPEASPLRLEYTEGYDPAKNADMYKILKKGLESYRDELPKTTKAVDIYAKALAQADKVIKKVLDDAKSGGWDIDEDSIAKFTKEVRGMAIENVDDDFIARTEKKMNTFSESINGVAKSARELANVRVDTFFAPILYSIEQMRDINTGKLSKDMQAFLELVKESKTKAKETTSANFDKKEADKIDNIIKKLDLYKNKYKVVYSERQKEINKINADFDEQIEKIRGLTRVQSILTAKEQEANDKRKEAIDSYKSQYKAAVKLEAQLKRTIEIVDDGYDTYGDLESSERFGKQQGILFKIEQEDQTIIDDFYASLINGIGSAIGEGFTEGLGSGLDSFLNTLSSALQVTITTSVTKSLVESGSSAFVGSIGGAIAGGIAGAGISIIASSLLGNEGPSAVDLRVDAIEKQTEEIIKNTKQLSRANRYAESDASSFSSSLQNIGEQLIVASEGMAKLYSGDLITQKWGPEQLAKFTLRNLQSDKEILEGKINSSDSFKDYSKWVEWFAEIEKIDANIELLSESTKEFDIAMQNVRTSILDSASNMARDAGDAFLTAAEIQKRDFGETATNLMLGFIESFEGDVFNPGTAFSASEIVDPKNWENYTSWLLAITKGTDAYGEAVKLTDSILGTATDNTKKFVEDALLPIFDMVRNFGEGGERENWGVSEWKGEVNSIATQIGMLDENSLTYYSKFSSLLEDQLSAMDSLLSVAESQLSAYTDTQKSIDDQIWDLTGGGQSTDTSLSEWNSKFDSLLSEATTVGAGGQYDVEAISAFQAFIPQWEDVMTAAGIDTATSIGTAVTALNSISDNLSIPITKLADLIEGVTTSITDGNGETNISIQIDGKEIAYVIVDQLNTNDALKDAVREA